MKKPHRAPAPVAPRSDRLIWGFHAARAAWLNPKRGIRRVLCSDAGAKGFADTLKATPRGLTRPPLEILDKSVLDRMVGGDAVHQGVVLEVDDLPSVFLQSLLDDPACTRLMVLDQVSDPHNVGAILRSACAFSCAGVVVQDRNAPKLTGTLAKAASGAAEHTPLVVETNLSRAIDAMKAAGFFVLGLDEGGQSIDKMPKYDRLALVMGAEGAGLRRLVGEHCDALVELPTTGAVATLNVSNAAAVALYATRK